MQTWPQDPSHPLQSPSQADRNSFIIEALLIAGDDEMLDLVLSPYHLRIARDGVVECTEISPPPDLDASQAIAVRLRLREGTPLRLLRSSQGIEEHLWVRRRSFALATRPSAMPFAAEPIALVARRNQFLAAFGIDPSEDS
jgi:hypothetical protein